MSGARSSNNRCDDDRHRIEARMIRPDIPQFERFVAHAKAARPETQAGVVVGEAGGVRVALVGQALLGDPGSAGKPLDGALLAAGLAREGAAYLRELHGPFALAALSNGGHDLLLAVDRLGVGSICHASHDGVLHFASDAGDVARALRGGGTPTLAARGGLDPQALFDYLYFHCIPGPKTVFSGVSRLLAGHALRVSDGRVTIEPYWTLRYEEHRRAPLETLERDFLSIVRGSVARAIIGAERPGAFLSGGTDSSTVSGMLGEVTGAPAKTYSIGFDAEGFDEIGFARIASKRFGTEHHEYYITPRDLVDSIPLIAAAYDQPFGNSSVLPTYYCARMAEADGVDRLLGGDGGDELFGGNTRYAKQRVFGYFDSLPAPLRAVARAGLAPSFWSQVPIVRKAKSYVAQADVRMPDRMQTYNLLTRIGIERIFEPAFLAEVKPHGPIEDMRDWYDRASDAGPLNRMLAFDYKYTLTDNDLPKVVTACRVAGVDVAFPLLDDALVDFAARLDPALKLKGFKLRWFFKHALRDFLPEEILHKSKHGFGLPFGLWLQRDAQLKELAYSSLESLKGRGIVRPDFIEHLRGDLVSDHATYYGELVWVLMMLEQWIRTHETTGVFKTGLPSRACDDPTPATALDS
jgi:asparagine synthase (glutamine-hydrolysing)